MQPCIWDYKDSVIQYEKLPGAKPSLFLSTSPEHAWSIGVLGNGLFRIEYDDEKLLYSKRGDYCIVIDKNSINEYWWGNYEKKSSYLVSLKDRSRKLLRSNQWYKGLGTPYWLSRAEICDLF